MRVTPGWTGQLVRAVLVAAMVLVADTVLAQGVVDRAKVLLREGKAAEAFELLDAAADKLNDAESAYLHGIAALDSGKAGLAIISFERALAYDPAFAPARAELVRALVATGETDQARIELARLATAEVPPEVRQKLSAIDKELASAVDAARRRTRGISSYVEADAGYDSNVNTGANSRTFAIPLFGGATATLNPIFQKHGSSFGAIGGGAMAYNEIRPGLRLFAGLDAKARYAFKELEDENYQTVYWSGSAGARWQRDGHTVSGALTVLENRVGSVLFDKQLGVYGQWQKQVTANDEAGLFAQWLDQKHPVQRSLDTAMTLLGVSWRHALEGQGLPILTASGYFGDDREKGADKAVGRRIVGARISYERQLDFGARLIAAAAHQRSAYGGENLFFNVVREDRRTDLSLGLAFSPAKDVTVTPQYMYTQNRSNIPVVDFRRHQLFVNLRRDFN